MSMWNIKSSRQLKFLPTAINTIQPRGVVAKWHLSSYASVCELHMLVSIRGKLVHICTSMCLEKDGHMSPEVCNNEPETEAFKHSKRKKNVEVESYENTEIYF